MKKSILFFLMLFPFVVNAQYPGGGSNSFVLHGEMEIALKDGSKIQFNGVVNGAKKIGETGLDYKDVDYIFLIKTSAKGAGYEKTNRTIYKYIHVKGKPILVKVRLESPKLSFYQGRPIMQGGGYNAIGVFQQHNYIYRTFIQKGQEENASLLALGKNRKNIPKIFPDCKRLIQYQKDKRMRQYLSLEGIVYIYNGNCNEASPEDMENDIKAIKKEEEKSEESILEKYGYATENTSSN